VHGGRDTIIPPAAGKYLAEHRPNSRFMLLAEAGHAPFLSHRDETLAGWRKFLS
jgi:pimeloyl-[acyl-carrier protein] methyl ester esterase